MGGLLTNNPEIDMKQTLKILTLSVFACAVAFNADAADKKKKKPAKTPAGKKKAGKKKASTR